MARVKQERQTTTLCSFVNIETDDVVRQLKVDLTTALERLQDLADQGNDAVAASAFSCSTPWFEIGALKRSLWEAAVGCDIVTERLEELAAS